MRKLRESLRNAKNPLIFAPETRMGKANFDPRNIIEGFLLKKCHPFVRRPALFSSCFFCSSNHSFPQKKREKSRDEKIKKQKPLTGPWYLMTVYDTCTWAQRFAQYIKKTYIDDERGNKGGGREDGENSDLPLPEKNVPEFIKLGFVPFKRPSYI